MTFLAKFTNNKHSVVKIDDLFSGFPKSMTSEVQEGLELEHATKILINRNSSVTVCLVVVVRVRVM